MSLQTSASPAQYESEAAFLEGVEQFVQDYVLPSTRAWEADRLPDDVFRRCAEVGLMGMTVPREHGGNEVSCVAYCEACRLVAQGDPALSMNLAAINALCLGHLVKLTTPEQREKYLGPAVRAEIELAWGLTEPDAGSDARRVQTWATPIQGREGYYHLNGQKMFITNGGRADLIIMIARTSEKELSAFLMETDQPGFQLGPRIPTIGVQASWTSQFELKDAVAWHTPCTFEEAISFLGRGRLGIAAMALGIAEKAHELAVAYSMQRQQFKRRLCDMQSVQNFIADSEMEIEAARLLVRKGAEMFDRGEDVTKAASMAKLYASETSNRVTNRAIQIHGGRGMTFEHLVEKLWRDAKLTEIGEGCSEIQRMVIAKQVCK
ncbi:MAG: acyl-CoA dehydrogenase family protein [Fimbriimonadaceae bacterium]|nr:acyl-CoA dehydrogenase family protein [Fimbriimonadaceae bacterium]